MLSGGTKIRPSTCDGQGWTLTTRSGRQIDVYFYDIGVNIVAGYSKARLPVGSFFSGSNREDQLLSAIETYKSRHIKIALRALLCMLIE